MAVLLAILAGLLGLLAAIVLIPFRARAAGAVHDGLLAGAARVDWGFGLLGVEVDTDRRVTVRLLRLPVARFAVRAGKGGERPRERPTREAKARGEARRRTGALRRLRGALAERGAFRRMSVRLLRALHLRLRASGRLGIGDPADTVALQALLAALGSLPAVELAIALDWVEEELDLELALAARAWIAELLAVAALLLLERANRRALRVALGWT